MSHMPWCIIRNFNDILSQENIRGQHSHPNWIYLGFKEAVNDCDIENFNDWYDSIKVLFKLLLKNGG